MCRGHARFHSVRDPPRLGAVCPACGSKERDRRLRGSPATRWPAAGSCTWHRSPASTACWAETCEDPAIPGERERQFGQRDHVRWYGADDPTRLAATR